MGQTLVPNIWINISKHIALLIKSLGKTLKADNKNIVGVVVGDFADSGASN